MKSKRVSFNTPIKIEFNDGRELIVRIYEEKFGFKKDLGFPISKDTPLAKAIINQQEGKIVEYMVRKNTIKVRILAVWN